MHQAIRRPAYTTKLAPGARVVGYVAASEVRAQSDAAAAEAEAASRAQLPQQQLLEEGGGKEAGLESSSGSTAGRAGAPALQRRGAGADAAASGSKAGSKKQKEQDMVRLHCHCTLAGWPA